MSVFNFDFRDNFKLNETKEEYDMVCMDYNKVVDAYYIKPEIYSDRFWEYITGKFNINDETYILTKTDVDVDEKNRIHKKYKYIVKCPINEHDYIFVSFYDEKRSYDDSDYYSYVSDDDKMNKVVDIVIYYDSDKFTTKELEDTIVEDILGLVYLPSTKNQFFTIVTGMHGYNLKSSYIKDIEIDLELNYGNEFLDTHKKILKNLKEKDHGLFLFHGSPGTGKTTYLRKLISLLSEDKTIIYVPSYMMHTIADPELISFISAFKDVILLLEDAENVLTKHSDERSQAVSNILNMSDGLLNDSLQIQIISTFNVESKMIDSALTRAGRLLVNYKFKELSPEDATKLSNHIGLEKTYKKSASLSEIYEGSNQIVNDDLDEKKPIGFEYKN